MILKLRPLLRAAPSAALTCGTSCAPGGSYNIINTDVASNGYLVDAGTTITTGNGVTYQTIPGQPVQNALIAGDQSLFSIRQHGHDLRKLGDVQDLLWRHDGRVRGLAVK